MIVAASLPLLFLSPIAVHAGDESNLSPSAEEKKQSLQQQIDALEQEASEIDQNIQETRRAAESLKNEIAVFNNEIKKRALEIKKIELAIKEAELEIQDKNAKITEVEAKVGRNREVLASSIVSLNEHEQESLLGILIKNASFSRFLIAIDNLLMIQQNIEHLLDDLKAQNEDLQRQKDDLEGFQENQTHLKTLAEIERKALSQKKNARDEILRLTKGKEDLFQKLLQRKKKDIAELRTQLFYLEKTGISAEDALKYADLAAKRAGIRTSFLLAILEVETGKQFEDGVISVGTNLGTGNWKTDMYDCYLRLGRRSQAEAQKRAFFDITDKLQFDPDQMPVSRRPRYGCGGAMGPAQFIPTTWLLYEDKVAALTGHNPPNPWNIEDAFTASAVFLAEAGATRQTREGELRAARIYISGKATCSSATSAGKACNYYANRVFALSQDIDRVI